MLGFSHKVGGVQGPGQVRNYVDAQEPDARVLHCLSLYEERSMFSLPGPPVVNDDLFNYAGVQGKVVFSEPSLQVLDLFLILFYFLKE